MLPRLLIGLLCSVLLATSALADVRVRGYVRTDGTYVQPHSRTAPDPTPRNNYSYPGNFNPNTGRITPGNPSQVRPLQPLVTPAWPRTR